MPMLIAFVEPYLEARRIRHVSVFERVADVGQQACGRLHEPPLQPANAAAEGKLRFGAKILALEHQHRVAVPGRLDLGKDGVVQARQIHTRHHGTQRGVRRRDLH